MFPSGSLCFALILGWVQFASAQVVVNSTFVGQASGRYSNADEWEPAEVPNNTATRHYNVTLPFPRSLLVDIDASISNLTLQGRPFVDGTTLTVTGVTVSSVDERSGISVGSKPGAPGTFNAGTLTAFSNNTLRGRFSLFGVESPATLQFRGANIVTLGDGQLTLYGPLARVVDEFGSDALRNLAKLEGGATFSLDGRNLTTFQPFTNEGILKLGTPGLSTIFTAANSLTNFNAATRTLTGGEFMIGHNADPHNNLPTELRFNGADIVNIGSKLSIVGPNARIADLAGNDGLRNLARLLPDASLTLLYHDLVTTRFQNDGLMTLYRTVFTVGGSFNNFDPSTRTLSRGAFEIIDSGDLKFNGADIVHNGSSIYLAGGSITDLTGNNGLRNFRDNLAGAAFVLGQDFTAPGDFTNAGRIEVEGKFIIPPGFSYTQTAGTTVSNGILTADRVNIFGGSLDSHRGTINGNITVTDATVFPGAREVINGDVTFNSGSRYHTRIDRFGDVTAWRQIAGKVVLAGTLEVELTQQVFLGSDAVLTVLKSNTSITGTFGNAPNGTRILTSDGRGSFVVVYEPKRVLLTQFMAEPPPAQLLNISSRAFLSASNDDGFGTRSVLIGGFIVTGTEAKTVALRGIGPSLSNFGLNPTVADPILELRDSAGAVIATNDSWKDAQQNAIAQNGLAPGDDREAALIAILNPGHSYTVVLKEKSGLAGYGLVEVYDLSKDSDSKLANISTRGFTDSSHVLIGGIIVAGNGQASDEVVVRALGSSLRLHGVDNRLDDPALELRDGNGVLLAFNDDWYTNFEQLPSDFRSLEGGESALRASLPRGNYTAIVRAKPNSGGVVVVEVYDLWR